MYYIVSILVFALLRALSTISAELSLDCTKSTCELNKTRLNFFLIGDWGGLPVWPWVTPAQRRVANTMRDMSPGLGTDFVLALGDNFYFTGIPNIDDTRLQTVFQGLYHNDPLEDLPWYLLGGNHDHYGNISAQVTYSKYNHNWKFPSLYYSVHYRLPDGTSIQLLVIDTVVLCGNVRNLQFADSFTYLTNGESHEPRGPQQPQVAQAQWEWIQQQLETSVAHYLFIAGHYPVYSVGHHGPTKCLVNRLKPLLHRHKVSAYFSGHDHNLQHLQTIENDWTVHYIVSGGAAYLDDRVYHKKSVPKNSLQYQYPGKTWYGFLRRVGLTSGAFVNAKIDKRSASFNFYKGDDTKLYRFEIKPRVL